MLEAAIAAGVTAAGGDALLAGVLPTPAAPLLVRRHGLHLAAVISASHNPYEDNGIKLFAADGFKLDDDTEHEIEAELEQPADPPEAIGRVRRFHGALEDYLRELHVRFADLDLSGRRGPARLRQRRHLPRRAGDLPPPRRRGRRRSPTSPTGATSTTAAARPISTACVERMRGGDHDVGFAFDGDGDRVLAVDRRGDGRRWRRAGRARGAAPARPRPAPRRRRRGHRDDQLRLPHRDGSGPGSRSRPPRSATATCSTSCAAADGRSAASSPATSSTSASAPRATASPARC